MAWLAFLVYAIVIGTWPTRAFAPAGKPDRGVAGEATRRSCIGASLTRIVAQLAHLIG